MKKIFARLDRPQVVLIALLFLLGITGCGGGGGASGPSIVGLEVNAAKAQLAAGTAQQYSATALYSDGSKQDITSKVTWTSSQPAVATVGNAAPTQGLVQAVKPGSTQINAISGSFSASKALTVTAAALSSIAVTPANPSVPNGLTKQFIATGTFTDGSTQDITSGATWSSSDTTIATVSNSTGSSGLAQTLKQGVATISAAASGITGSTSLTVTAATLTSLGVTPANPSVPKGLSKQFTATGTYSDGSTQDLTSTAAWSSSDTTIATIGNGATNPGLAQTLKVGSATISAVASGFTGSTGLTVTAATLASIGVTPANPSVPKGLTQQFTATGTYTDTTTQDLTATAIWSSSDTTVAPISNASGSSGLAAASTPGNATISAVSQGISGSTLLTVTAASLKSIQVTPTNPKLATGFQRPFTATGRFSDNSTQDITQQVTWSSTNTAAATIDNSAGNQGVATGVAAGATTITAQQGSVIGQTSLTVTAATLSSLSVTPASPSIPLGNKQQFTATGTFSDNTTQDLTTQVAWASSDTTVATVGAATGLASSVKPGTSTITAAKAAVSGGTVLTVSQKALTAINLTAVAGSVPKGETDQFTASGTYTDGSSGDITTSVTWSSSDATIATISNASGSQGLATAQGIGSATITATQSGVTGSKGLTVTAAVLASINVTPPNASVPLGLTQQYTATGVYSDNTTHDLTATVTWGSSNQTVATVSNASGSNGLATTLATGTTNIAAVSGSVAGSAKLTVTAVALRSISVTPANASLPNGEFLQYTATGHYSDGSTQDLTQQVAWASDNSAVADISNAAGSQGKAIAKSLGTVHITATDAATSISGSTPLTVTAAQLVAIAVNGASPLAAGYSAQYVATGSYSDGSTQDITTAVTWAAIGSSATVSNATGSKGVVQGVQAGSASITAGLSGVSGTSSVTVTTATLSSITVTPANATIHPNGTLQYTGTGKFSDGSTLDLTQQVTWASDNTNAVTISNAAGSKGLASAGMLIGTANISATLNSVTGSTPVTRAPN